MFMILALFFFFFFFLLRGVESRQLPSFCWRIDQFWQNIKKEVIIEKYKIFCDSCMDK